MPWGLLIVGLMVDESSDGQHQELQPVIMTEGTSKINTQIRPRLDQTPQGFAGRIRDGLHCKQSAITNSKDSGIRAMEIVFLYYHPGAPSPRLTKTFEETLLGHYSHNSSNILVTELVDVNLFCFPGQPLMDLRFWFQGRPRCVSGKTLQWLQDGAVTCQVLNEL